MPKNVNYLHQDNQPQLTMQSLDRKMTVSDTKFGGAELVSILRKKTQE